MITMCAMICCTRLEQKNSFLRQTRIGETMTIIVVRQQRLYNRACGGGGLVCDGRGQVCDGGGQVCDGGG